VGAVAEPRLRIGTTGGAAGDEIARRTFAKSVRGFEPAEVRAFLESVGVEVDRLREQLEVLEAELSEARKPPEPQPMDIATLTAALGEETARVLRSAQEAGVDLRAKAEQGAARTLNDAHEEAARLRGEADRVLSEAKQAAAQLTSTADAAAAEVRAGANEAAAAVRFEAEALLAARTAEAEAEVGRLRAEAENEVSAQRAESTAQAEAAVAAAVARGKEMVVEAQAARERMLRDLARRRDRAVAQLDALRAGKQRLLEAYTVVRVSLDEVTIELERADREAAAALALPSRPDTTTGAPPDLLDALVAEALSLPAPAPAGSSPTTAEVADATEADAAGVEGSGGEEVAIEEAVVVIGDAAGGQATELVVIPGGDRVDLNAGADEPSSRPAPGMSAKAPLPAGDPAPAAALPEETVGATKVAARAPVAKVDHLFAQIRADRAKKVAEAKGVLGEPKEVPPSPALEPPSTSSAPTVVDDAAGARAAATGGPTAGTEAASTAVDEVAASDESERLLQARDSRCEQLEVTLVRKLRRALQDEQNLVLDRVRTQRGRVSFDVLLPSMEDHPNAYLAAAMPLIVDAEDAGAAFALAEAPALARASSEPAPVGQLGRELADELVGPLRQRIERALKDTSSGDGAAIADALNAVYREWKSQRIERVAADRVIAAFSLGVARALPEGTNVRWILDDAGGPCPDCDDNTLAADVTLGEPFPTGQALPPAHTGCRCLVVPVST
jgi:DivIVA domain-containing protein